MFFKDNWGMDFPLFLAPMAGVTDYTFRGICKKLGADVIVTEFVSAEGILQENSRTKTYTYFDDTQRPLGVQLFGNDGDRMALASDKLISWKTPDFIDINFGCPAKKVVCKSGGAALLKDLKKMGQIVNDIYRAVGSILPISAKIRIGWDSSSIVAMDACRVLEDSGASFITIHGRTKVQGYTGEADWDIISQCAESVNVPVIGNGDLNSALDIKKKKDEALVSGVMIGRSAMSYPWIFKETKNYLKTGEISNPVSDQEKIDLIINHVKSFIKNNPNMSEESSIRALRSRLMAYSKGLPNGKNLRKAFSKVLTSDEIEKILQTLL